MKTAPARPGQGGFVRSKFLWLILLLCCSIAAGCGYRPVARDVQSRFGEGETISIPIFANKTYKPNLENILLNDLIDEFAKRKGLRVEERESSDYNLEGEVLTYGKVAVAYTGYDFVKEYRATMTVAATLRKNSTQRIIWRGMLSWSQDFPASSDIAIQQNSEDVAIQEISRRLAQQIYLKLIEDF